MLDRVKQSMYYIIIGVISFIALVFLPMLGTTIGLEWNLPTTVVGWIVWVSVKIIVAIINILIFHSFICQGKLNVKDNPNYKKALEIMGEVKQENFIPRAPKQWRMQTYGKKGLTIFLFSLLTTVSLTQAILTFDWISMLTYLFTILTGIIFGIFQMKAAEEYWTEEFYNYAIMLKNTASQKTPLNNAIKPNKKEKEKETKESKTSPTIENNDVTTQSGDNNGKDL